MVRMQIFSHDDKKRFSYILALLHRGCLVMNEMSIKRVTTYQKQYDSVCDLVDLGGAEAEFNLEDKLANHLHRFVFAGLSSLTRIQVPVFHLRLAAPDGV